MKDWKDLKRTATRDGWRVITTGRNHLKWLSPDGRTMLFTGATPSDWRAIKNHKANMKRAGYAY